MGVTGLLGPRNEHGRDTKVDQFPGDCVSSEMTGLRSPNGFADLP